MRKIRSLAAIAAGLTVPLTLAVLFFILSAYRLLQPEIYQDAFSSQNTYARFSSLVARQLAFYFHQEGIYTKNISEISPVQNGAHHLQDLLPLMGRLSQADWEVIIDGLLPPEYIRQQVDGVVDQSIANVTGLGPSGQILVSTRVLKDRLQSEAGLQAFLRLLRAQRLCESEGVEANISGQELTLPTCRPPEDEIQASIPQYRWVLRGIAGDIPDEYNLIELLPAVSPAVNDPTTKTVALPGTNPFASLQRVRVTALLVPIVPVVLLLLIALAGVRSWADLLRWWGGPLLSAGLLGLALSAGLQPALNGWTARFTYATFSPYFTSDLVNLLVNVVHAIIAPLGRWFALGSIGLAVVGGALLVVYLGMAPWTHTPKNSETP